MERTLQTNTYVLYYGLADKNFQNHLEVPVRDIDIRFLMSIVLNLLSIRLFLYREMLRICLQFNLS